MNPLSLARHPCCFDVLHLSVPAAIFLAWGSLVKGFSVRDYTQVDWWKNKLLSGGDAHSARPHGLANVVVSREHRSWCSVSDNQNRHFWAPVSHAAGCIVVSFRWGQGYGDVWTLDVAFWMGDMGAVPLIWVQIRGQQKINKKIFKKNVYLCNLSIFEQEWKTWDVECLCFAFIFAISFKCVWWCEAHVLFFSWDFVKWWCFDLTVICFLFPHAASVIICANEARQR